MYGNGLMKLKRKQGQIEPGYPPLKIPAIDRRQFIKATYLSTFSVFLPVLLVGCKKRKKHHLSSASARPDLLNSKTTKHDVDDLNKVLGYAPIPQHPYRRRPARLEINRPFPGFDSQYNKGEKLFNSDKLREARDVWQSLLDDHYYEMSNEQYSKLIASLSGVNYRLTFAESK